jgi:hypothetical protein
MTIIWNALGLSLKTAIIRVIFNQTSRCPRQQSNVTNVTGLAATHEMPFPSAHWSGGLNSYSTIETFQWWGGAIVTTCPMYHISSANDLFGCAIIDDELSPPSLTTDDDADSSSPLLLRN